ncbi:putative envelope protein ODV-E56-1 [Microplitis demolitor]|uniref:putative envelope protein ODV-E56-1 n=1 Tax=Microplitis demolitor TaxID=69319 RepID=UPI000440019D|nr:putative envelope protein ODV-E56-1 [Microplitis demolitor]KAG6558454.1 putative envelope protein ODV-E56-1 [Microplitis demolitor]
MSSIIKSFFTKLRNLNDLFPDAGKNLELKFQTEIVEILDDPNNNPGLNVLKKIFTNAQFDIDDGEVFMNKISIKEIECLLRKGNLREFNDLLHISQEVTAHEEKSFQNLLLSEVPDIHILKFGEKYKKAQIEHPDLDVFVGSSNEIQKKLTNAAKKKFDRYLNRLRDLKSIDGIIDGLFAKMRVDGNLEDNIAKASVSRQGCYLVKKDAHGITSCKLINRSCVQSNLYEKIPDKITSVVNSLQYNLQVYLYKAMNDGPEKQKLKTNLSLDESECKVENIPYLISKYESQLWKNCFESQLLKNSAVQRSIPSLCNDIFKTNKEDACISCSPCAPRNSINYVNTSKLPFDMTMLCVKRATLLEVLLDMGVDLSTSICVIV